mgnify:CR=1 FL=1
MEKEQINSQCFECTSITFCYCCFDEGFGRTSRTNRTRFVNNYIKPLLELELIQMKYPENPHHHAQKYMLTEIGKMLLEKLK